MFKVIGCILHQHDLRLVALAAGMCAMACFTTLSLLAWAQLCPRERRNTILVVAGCVFGVGVWSLHFVAMLAFMPGMAMSYDMITTAASIAVAMAGASLAFLVWRLPLSRLPAGIAGGSLLGLAVSAMHYAGMAALRPHAWLRLAPAEVASSIAIGVVFAAVALCRATTLKDMRRRAEICLWLSLCICGVHFTGMAAVTMQVTPNAMAPGALVGSSALALVVGAVSLALLVVSLAGTLMEQRLSERTVMELRRMRLLSNLSQEVMIIHRNGAILEANAAGSRLFEIPPGQLIGTRVLDLFAPEAQAAVGRRLDHAEVILLAEEVTAITRSGRLIPVEISSTATDYDGKPAAAMALRDLTDRKISEDRIRHLAHHDALTDLPNRSLLHERLARAIADAADGGESVALLYLDLDRFKPVNDLLGHAGGDALLVQVADRLRATLRPDDTLARVGGDEFVIVNPVGATPQAAVALAGRVIETLRRPFDLLGRRVEIGTSIGIALYPQDADDQETLIRAADTALYRVKEDARGAYCLYQSHMDEHLQERRQMEQDLRHAVDRHELELHFQPVLNCASGQVEGFEALVRWRHPQRGLMSPLDFIPLAEKTQQIDRIGAWVIEAACEDAMAWPQPHWVAVNVSPFQLLQTGFAARVAAVLARTGLAAGRLEIEVTESVFIDDRSRIMGILSALRRLGVRVALDDFGTGYSSLSYLCSFAFDKIKIDRSFIQALGQSEEANTVVRTIISLGHELGLSITAEGIELEPQFSLMVGWGCDQVQGYLFGRPQPTLPDPTPNRAPAELPRADLVLPERLDRFKADRLATLCIAP